MSRGLGLLVGLKEVDPASYGGWDGRNGCWGCELDVDNVSRILSPLGFQLNVLKTRQARASNILRSLRSASELLKEGDIFVFYFSGHGGQQPDFDGDELDNRDETLVAFDRQIIDDELNEIWPKFKPGVRIVMLSDSCNSGTNFRMVGAFDRPTPFVPVAVDEVARKMRAQMIHMGGCRDGFTSSGYLSGGAFTVALCDIWNGGEFQGDYRNFHAQVAARISSGQRAQYNEYGPVADAFRSQRPFTIARTGGAVRIECSLELESADPREARALLEAEAGPCLLDAYETALSQQTEGSPGPYTGASSGNWSCSGTVSVHFQ